MQVVFGECELEVGGDQPAASVGASATAAAVAAATARVSARPPKSESVPPTADTNGAV
jgi:hypothetical protein